MTNEIWAGIGGFDGYEVSNLGRVRSVGRRCRTRFGTRAVPPKILNVDTANVGRYPRITLFNEGGRVKFKVADLVASAFIGPKPDGMQTCHEDGVPANSKSSNLRYDTPKGNAADKKRHGTDRRRPKVLTEQAVIDIVTSSASGLALAKQYGVSQGAISHVRTGRNWSHVNAS